MGKYGKYFEIYIQINKLKHDSVSTIICVVYPFWQRSVKQYTTSENVPLLAYHLTVLSAVVIV